MAFITRLLYTNQTVIIRFFHEIESFRVLLGKAFFLSIPFGFVSGISLIKRWIFLRNPLYKFNNFLFRN